MTELIETVSLPVSYRIPAADADYDPRYVKTLEVLYNVIEVHDEITDRQANGRPMPDGVDQEYVDELEAAFRAGRRVLDHDRRDEIARDMSKCEPDLLRELRATVAYVAPHFNIKLDVPAPDDSEGDESPA